jgi:beta-galactosidase
MSDKSRLRILAATLVVFAACPQPAGPAGTRVSAAALSLEQQLDALVVTARPQLTPRPAIVAGVAKPLMSLSGSWEFSPANRVPARPIEVPGEWAMQGFEVPAGGFATYTREVEVPADWQGQTVKLRFDAVHAVCEVVVNGQSVGGHEGGFVPFELDVTKAIHPGRNEIVVRVQSESIADSVSCISQYAAHQVGGLIRKVTLFAVPTAHVSNLWYETTVAGGDARVVVHTELPSSVAGSGLVVDHRLLDQSGRRAAVAGGDAPLLVKAARLWTPETPDLYVLETTLRAGGKPMQILRQRVGLREVRVTGNRVFVNGRPIKLVGINRHEVHPLRGRSLTPELCRRDAELFRAANVNLVRTSHYPPSEEFLDACDELGIFVESEAAICWVEHGASPYWKTNNHLDPKFFPYLLRATMENIAAHRTHPSVLMWSLGNESLWTPLFAKVLEVAKKDDATRPFTFHDQAWGGYNNAGSTADIANYHYPGENNSAEWSKLSRPVWFGEYAHLQCYNRRELMTDPWIREDWGRPLVRMVDLMWEQPGALGGAIWSGVDDVFHMPNGDIRGYGHWGPIDGWRRQKPEWLGMKNAYTPFRVFKSDVAPDRPIVLTVQNRFNFTNLRDARITWATSGGGRGTVKASLEPHGKGTVTVPVKGARAGDKVTLTVTDRRGVEVAREVFTVPDPLEATAPAQPDRPPTGAPLAALARAAEAIGLPEQYRMLRPLPMLLPLNDEGGNTGPAGRQLANEIEPFTAVPPDTVVSGPESRGADLVYRVSTAGVSGSISIRPVSDAGAFDVSYRLEILADVDPRQWGLVFTLPLEFDTLRWVRNAQWSWYPDDHIGRPAGSAHADAVARRVIEEPGKALTGPWALDANALGTNDFRSTKGHVREAGLSARDGRSFQVVSPDASQSVRAWVDGDRIRLLVAAFNTGGDDHFFDTHYAAERRPLKKGATISSSFRLVLRKSLRE